MRILFLFIICLFFVACGDKKSKRNSTAPESVAPSPSVSIDTESLVGITTFNAINFTIKGSCSEEGQPVLVSVGDVNPETAPICSNGSWEVTMDVSLLLTGASRPITIIVDHATSGGQALPQVSQVVTLYPRVGIATHLGNITGDIFAVSGTCSEEGQSVAVSVGGESPSTAPLCTSTGTWSTSVDVSGLTGASREITITAGHSTSGSNPLAATQAMKTVTLYPRVGIATGLGNITGDTFAVSGTCSEDGQAVTLVVGAITPSPAPTCTSGAWSVSVDVSGLGASGEITMTAGHSTSGSNPLTAIQAMKTVTLYPRVSIAASVGNITGDTFTVNGTCSEDGQAVAVSVGGESPSTAPLCTSTGTWSTSVDVSGLTGASREITMTAGHSTSGSNPLAATQAMKTVTLYPRVSIAASVGNITGDTFAVSGTCSEDGQAVAVSVGGESPSTAPLCTSTGTWSTSVDVSGLTGASREITITANHSTSGSSSLDALEASEIVTLYPRVSIAASVGNITGDTFTVNGTCSEDGQAITLVVGSITPSPAPTCTSGTWSTSVDVSGLGASGEITMTAGHSTSGSNPLAATQAMKTVTLYPRVSIATNLGNITGDTFAVNGTCSEDGQAITLVVGSITPSPAPTCTSTGTWSVSVDVSGLTGASREITITAGHSTSGSNPLAATQAMKTVTLYPRVGIATNLGNITEANASSFRVTGTCSENNQPVTVSVGTVVASPAPNCSATGTWSADIDVSSLLTGASREITITAGHSTSGGLAAAPASETVTLAPRVSIADSVGNITQDTFTVNGTCSENSQAITLVVGLITPSPAPTCTSGTWSVSVDVSGLTGASRPIAITADHSTSGASPLNATQAMKTVTLYPRVGINTESLVDITSFNSSSFPVSGTCSENNQPVTVSVGTVDASTAPTCTSGAWSVDIDVSALSGTSVVTAITANHSTSSDPALSATPATASVLLNPPVSINTPALENITAINAASFVVSGACSENDEPVIVSVGGVSPETVPNCTTGAWTTDIDVTGLNQMSGTILVTADHSPSGGPAHPQATANVINEFICPLNYVGVPALSDYTTNSFCVMKYEAKYDSGDAISQASGTPYVNINRNNSIARCTALGDGHDMITNDEWQSLARNIELVPENWATGAVGNAGGLSRGHSDNSPSRALAASNDDNNGCFGTGQEADCDGSTWNAQRRTHTLSNGQVIWDMSGNVSEWMKDTNNFNYGAEAYMSQVTTASHPALGSLAGGTTTTPRNAKNQFGPSGDYTSLNSTPYGGLGNGWPNYTRGGVIRGGPWDDRDRTGVFRVSLYSETWQLSRYFGFRCTYHP